MTPGQGEDAHPGTRFVYDEKYSGIKFEFILP